jgi:hypothetical protein
VVASGTGPAPDATAILGDESPGQQGVDDAVAGDPADPLDVGAGHGLLVGDDGQDLAAAVDSGSGAGICR